jgi:hypothetical protein
MVTFTAIEEGMASFLKEKVFQANEVDLPSLLSCKMSPSFHCRIMQFKTERQAMSRFKILPVVSLFLALKHTGTEKARRQGMHPLIHAVTRLLTLQRLGLDITPLVPVDGKELNAADSASSGIVLYQIDFRTSYVDTLPEEEAGNLLTLGLEYYLKPGDATQDAGDVVDLEN